MVFYYDYHIFLKRKLLFIFSLMERPWTYCPLSFMNINFQVVDTFSEQFSIQRQFVLPGFKDNKFFYMIDRISFFSFLMNLLRHSMLVLWLREWARFCYGWYKIMLKNIFVGTFLYWWLPCGITVYFDMKKKKGSSSFYHKKYFW